MGAKIGIVVGSDSDLKVIQKVTDTLKEFEQEYELVIASAHRVPDRVEEFSAGAEKRGLQVIIAAAGLAAHLPGVVASRTVLPVIGLPIGGGPLSGVDALYSIVQMPGGIPVATVGIDNGKNAALLALQILSAGDPSIREQLKQHKQTMADAVNRKNDRLQKFGVEGYLKTK